MMMAAHVQVGGDLPGGVDGEGEMTRLVELGLAHKQTLLSRIVVANAQAQQLTATQTRGVEQHNGQAIDLSTEG